MSYVVALDTNIYRGVGDELFKAILAAEASRSVIPHADPWSMVELLAHLSDPSDPAFGPSKHAVRRLSHRCLRPPPDGRAHGVLADAEVQIAQFVTGRPLEANKGSTLELVTLCQAVETTDPTELPAAGLESLGKLAEHVMATEEWFAGHIAEVKHQLQEAMRSSPDSTISERNKAIEAFFQSDAAARLDAGSLIRRAYSQQGLAIPVPVPEDLITRVVEAFRAGITATALAYKRTLQNDVNLNKPRIRNLIWDQNIAFNIGQRVLDRDILIVTKDGYFRDAAVEAGFPDAVYGCDQYLRWLGVAV